MNPASPSDRREAILNAARICFLDRGFVRTTISDIVALCGGSRTTVYEEFGSKEALFKALVSSIIDQMRLPDIPPGPPGDVLRELGLAYMERLMDPETLALYRVALGESAHIRHLGAALFEAGPKSAASALAGTRDRRRRRARAGARRRIDPGQGIPRPPDARVPPGPSAI